MFAPDPDTPSGNLEERLRRALTGRFEIERELPGGGMSRVFVARETSLDRKVVVKVLPPDVAAEVNRDRFRQEVQFAARLQHPHIVPLHAAGEEQGLLYYTMPFIDGESIKAEIARGRRFTESEAVEILIDVTDALAYAHAAGIVHRDIKPANILRSGAHAVVTDFGVAKALTAALRTRIASAGITTSGVAIGTPAYMAPEQIAGDPAADHRVDIYAIGLLAYEMLSGQAPFRGPSPQAMMAAHLTGNPEPLGKLRPDLSRTLTVIVQRCLEKEASRRPASAAALLEVLRTIAFSSDTQPSGAFAVSNRRRNVATLAAVAVIGTLAWIGVSKARSRTDLAEAQARAAQDSVRRTDSTVQASARAAANDSIGRLAAQRAEQKRLQRATDSIIGLQRRALDSAMEALKRSGPPPQTLPPLSAPLVGSNTTTQLLSPEAFQARALNMGPPRRVFVELGSSMIRSPDVVLRAGVVRDSIIRRLGASARFRPISIDTAQAALTRTRNFDTLAVLTNVELFVTVRTTPLRGDSVQWQIDARDQTANSAYSNRSATARGGSVAEGLQLDIPRLLDQVVRNMAEMDRAPRRIR
jgi:serine/threonine-protein kinase